MTQHRLVADRKTYTCTFILNVIMILITEGELPGWGWPGTDLPLPPGERFDTAGLLKRTPEGTDEIPYPVPKEKRACCFQSS